MNESIEYKGFNIEIIQDQIPENPIDYDDGLPTLYVVHDKNMLAYNEQDNIDINYALQFTKEEIKNNLSEIKSLLNFYRSDKYKFSTILGYLKSEIDYNNYDDVVDCINDAIAELYQDTSLSYDHYGYCEKLTMFSEMLTIKGIKHKLGSSRGYYQGDYIEMLAIDTEETKDYDLLESTQDLYSAWAWAWNDCYGFNIEGLEYGCLFGFFGSDHNASGLIDQAKEEINFHIKSQRQKRLKKTRQMIKNRVPLETRYQLINGV